jgi:NAD(P)H-quinone oxidoreductase subunit 2
MFDLTSVAFALEASPFLNYMVSNNVPVLSAELMVFVTALLVLGLSLSRQDKNQALAPLLALVGLALSLVTLFLHGSVLFSGDPLATKMVLNTMIQGDLLGVLLRSLVVIGSIASIFLAKPWVESHLPTRRPEFFSLMLIATLGAMLLCGASDMVMMFVSLETLGIMAYLLVALLKTSKAGIEAALKYLIYGGASSAVLLFGLALLYGFSGGTTEFSALFQHLGQLKEAAVWQTLAFACVLVGVGFKLGAAPFHMWSPDVYEGAPTPVTLFLATVSKVAALALALRLLPMAVHSYAHVGTLLVTMAVASIILGNLLALRQTNLKRLLAYSSIAHVGYLLLGFVLSSQATLGAVVFYLVGYVFMTIASFTCVQAMESAIGSDALAALPHVPKQQPLLAGVLAVVFAALAGMPLTAGFFGKLFLFQTLVSSGVVGVALMTVALLGSLVSLGYYLNVVYQLLKPSTNDASTPHITPTGVCLVSETPTQGILIVSLGVSLLLGILGSPLYALCTAAVNVVLAQLIRY